MIGLFKWAERHGGAQLDGLGQEALLLRVPSGSTVPPACTGLVCEGGVTVRRVDAGKRVDGEVAYCFHPGPYVFDVAPFPAAPEVGLRLQLAIDAPDPRLRQQRFDLFVLAEAEGRLDVSMLRTLIEATLERELAQGGMQLAPCSTIDEWNAFRAALNHLVYARFGLTVEDCYPVDLGESVDYAAILRARAAAGEVQPRSARVFAALRAAPSAPPCDPEQLDAHALRRLFLEVPGVLCRLRAADVAGCADFHARQRLLARLDAVNLSVATMPALVWEAPGRRLAEPELRRRAQASAAALEALDEAWALLARIDAGGEAACQLLADTADRIVANLERAVAERRATRAPAPEAA